MGCPAVVAHTWGAQPEGGGQWDGNAEADQRTDIEHDNRSRWAQAAVAGRFREETGVSLYASRDQYWNRKHGSLEAQAGWWHQESMKVVKPQPPDWGLG